MKGLTVFNITRGLNGKDSSVAYVKGGQRSNMVPDYCETGISGHNKEELMKKIDAFVQSRKFNLKYEVKDELLILKSYGQSAHVSTPELGKNAIMQSLICLCDADVCSGDIRESVIFLAETMGLETKGKSFRVCLHDAVSGYLSFNVDTIDMDKERITLFLNLSYPVTKTFEDMMKPI